MRYIGLHRAVEEIWDNGFIDQESKEVFQAFSDGLNDFIKGVSLTSIEGNTARLLPPEFITFGITKENWEPWTPQDCMITMRLMSFHMTWNWGLDLSREAMRQNHPLLAELVDEIMPFTSDMLVDQISIVDDDDLKQWGQYSEESLVEKYRKASKTIDEAGIPISKPNDDENLN